MQESEEKIKKKKMEEHNEIKRNKEMRMLLSKISKSLLFVIYFCSTQWTSVITAV